MRIINKNLKQPTLEHSSPAAPVVPLPSVAAPVYAVQDDITVNPKGCTMEQYVQEKIYL